MGQPTTQFDAFISYSSKDAEWVLGWLVPVLQQAGLAICVDHEHFDVGVPFIENMVNAVTSSKRTVLVLTPSWVESQWTRFESLLAQMGDPIGANQQVVPVLRIPCQPPPNIAMFSYLQMTDRDDLETEVARLVEVLKGKRRLPLSRHLVNRGRLTLSEKQRRFMLQSVKKFWVNNFLQKSLGGLDILPVAIRHEPAAVQRPWDLVLEAFDRESRMLPAESRILDVYDEVRGSLLILGEPGAGKTIALLELARDAIARAEDDPDQPLPVVFNLSSWATQPQPLSQWLIDELNAKYDVPRRIGTEWVRKDQLLLLLDGLDEVQADHRDACVQAINDFIQSHGFTQIVVCSRTADYRALKLQLGLHSAVILQPFTIEQLNEYLERAGPQMAAVREAVMQDAELQEMARSPLMLNLLAATYGETDMEEAQGQIARQDLAVEMSKPRTPEERRRRLFDHYIQKMLKRRGKAYEGVYPPSQTLTRLGWLARRLRIQGEYIFLLEQMQPSWLRRSVKLYALVNASLIALLLAGPAIIIQVWEAVEGREATGLNTYSGMFFFVGLISIGAYLIAVEPIRTVDQLRWSWRRGGAWLLGFFALLALGALLNLPRWLVYDLCIWGGLGALAGAALGTLLKAAAARLLQSTCETGRMACGFDRLLSARNGAILLGGVGIIYVLVKSLMLLQTPAGMESLFSGIKPLFNVTALFGPALLFFGGLSRRKLAQETRTSPNAAIHRTIRNALLIGASAPLLIMLTAAAYNLVATLAESAAPFKKPGFWLGAAYYVSIIACLWSGGFSSLRHYILRWMLHKQGHAPWNYTAFLDYCAGLIFLRKVGVGYVFVHRLLAEHFAALGKDKDMPVTTDSVPLVSPATVLRLKRIGIGAFIGAFAGSSLAMITSSVIDNLTKGHYVWPIIGVMVGLIIVGITIRKRYFWYGLLAGAALACLVAAQGGKSSNTLMEVGLAVGAFVGTVIGLFGGKPGR